MKTKAPITKRLKSARPKSVAVRSTLVVMAVLMAAGGVMQFSSTDVRADVYDDQLKALQKEVDNFSAEAQKLAQQADSLSNAIAKLQNEQAQVQAEISLNEVKAKDLAGQITTNEKKLADQEDVLANTLVDMYLDGQTTPIEVLAGSKSLGDYVDQQSQRATVRDQVSYSTKQIKILKQQLEDQKKEVEQIISDQKVKKQQLVASQNEQARLLNETQGQEAAYQQKVSDVKAQMEQVHAQQRAAWAAATNGGNSSSGNYSGFSWRKYTGEQGCSGGYPYCAGGLDYTVDEFALYARECVSYAAWAAKYRFGKSVGSFRGQGHAYQWVSSAPAYMGAFVNDTPAVGAAAIMPANGLSSYGHAMIVEYVLNDGWVGVSQYNFAGNGQYSTMEIPASSVAYVHFR